MDIHLILFYSRPLAKAMDWQKAGIPLVHASTICINRHQFKHVVMMATGWGMVVIRGGMWMAS